MAVMSGDAARVVFLVVGKADANRMYKVVWSSIHLSALIHVTTKFVSRQNALTTRTYVFIHITICKFSTYLVKIMNRYLVNLGPDAQKLLEVSLWCFKNSRFSLITPLKN